jgi:S1-C subfamily serine protease
MNGDDGTPVNPKGPSSWWITVPGLLTAAAGFVVAITGLIGVLAAAGIIGGEASSAVPTSPPTTEMTVASSPTTEALPTTAPLAATTVPETTTPASSVVYTPADLAENFGDAVFKIETSGCGYDGIGSGFAIDEHHIVTARHVVQIDTTPTLWTRHGESMDGRVIGWREAPDVAVIEVDRTLPTVLPWVDTDRLTVGQQLISLGYPLPQHDFSVIPGVIMSFVEEGGHRTGIRSDADLDSGNSGGPSLTDNAAVAGVVTFMDINPDGFQRVPVVVPYEALAEAVDSIVGNPLDPVVECDDLIEPLPAVSATSGTVAPNPTQPNPPTTQIEPVAVFPVPPFYAVFLKSMKTHEYSRGDALRFADQFALQFGVITNILLSDDYGSLNPGYWVAYTGAFPSEAGAEAEADRLKGLGHPDAYAREVAWP